MKEHNIISPYQYHKVSMYVDIFSDTVKHAQTTS